MEALKNAVAVLAGIVGLVTAFLTLYAKYLDLRKNAARVGDASDAVTPENIGPKPAPNLDWFEAPSDAAVSYVPPTRNSAAVVERSREAVKAPAITLLAAGLVTLFSNLFIAGFGYVDQFVTPLTTESQNKRAFMAAAQRNNVPPYAPVSARADSGLSDDATVALTICTLISLSIASAAAAWAGYGMLRLRSYWLSVAGSFAIMAGGAFCCFAGIPIGIWSLSVLYKPDVAASFR
jgi:hypothetical protein